MHVQFVITLRSLPRLLVLLALVAAGQPLLALAHADYGSVSFDSEIRPLLQKYCYDCHGGKKTEEDVDLKQYESVESIQIDSRVWRTVRRVIDEHEMPPFDEDVQPTELEREKLAGWLKWADENIDPKLVPKDPGHVVLHRLTKLEFDNTYSDLLGVEPGLARNFPDDRGGSTGFENSADSMVVSSMLIENLLNAAGDGLAEADIETLFGALPPEGMKVRDQREYAEQVLERFMVRAWRRPVSRAEVRRMMRLYDDYTRKKKQSWEQAMRQVYRLVLVAPPFIYRVEKAQAASGAYLLSHYEMASRLSYFLWSTMPDDELFQLAADEKLQDPAVLTQQVERMLNDPRSDIFLDRFVSGWLGIDDLRHGAGPDPTLVTGFTDQLRASMAEEPVAFLRHLVDSNGNLLDFIDSDYIFVNEDTAPIYGVRGVSGQDFQKTKRPGPDRGGVITMPAILAMNSNATRTSPVRRGAWVLARLLDAPPAAPPANVPDLEDAQDEQASGSKAEPSQRDLLERHRDDPNCASCHNRIDPLGFGLEGYDVLGASRRIDDYGQAVDSTGTLLTGETFANATELKQVMMKRKDMVMRVVVEKMLAYALGRKLEPFDRPVVSELINELEQNNYPARDLIIRVATSFPMRYKRNRPIGIPGGR